MIVNHAPRLIKNEAVLCYFIDHYIVLTRSILSPPVNHISFV